MKINEKNTINSIQQEFLKNYPYLKIEFYKQSHEKGEGSIKDHIINGDLTLAEIPKKPVSGSLQISGSLKVSELERAFTDIFGIGAQIFRKSGNTWLQTTTSDELTLDQQSQKAKDHDRASEEEEMPDAMDRQELE